MTEEPFYKAFKENMDLMGLPCPNTLFGTITTASATIGALANAVKTLPTTATLGEVLLSFPIGAAAAGVATAVVELTTLFGALCGSFYLGACIGSLIGASLDVYGPRAYGMISGVLTQISKSLNTSINGLIESTLRAHPLASPIRPSVVMAPGFR